MAQDATLVVNEIFVSIDGEGKTAGMLTTFVRLAGCNLRCAWCDTAYALKKEQGTPMAVSDVVAAVTTRSVTLTGGEPLEQSAAPELVRQLMAKGIDVNVETNGSRDTAPLLALPQADSHLIITLDWKLPASRMEAQMHRPSFAALREQDVLKFVVASVADLERAYAVLDELQPRSLVYFSPVFGAIEPVVLVNALRSRHESGHDVSRLRVQLQLHKIIWHPEERGV
ncbi:MAG: radical SAM protein [Akkermansia sp.]|nr:radical SAM protein [Akkermansia sp.]